MKLVNPIKKTPVLIKLGGSALQNPDLVAFLCINLKRVYSAGIPMILVHGGGPCINEELTRRGISWKFHQGQRITSEEMMEVVEMVLCGKVNRQIVRSLNTYGVQAVGISGTDANLLHCELADKILGQVGVIQSINTDLISSFLQTQKEMGKGLVPVIAPVGTNGKGAPLNINADWAASRLAQDLGIRKMIYITDQDGVLDASGTLIPYLNSDEIENLIARETITGGMLAKANAILSALRNEVTEIHVINGNKPQSLLDVLLSRSRCGTSCIGTSAIKKDERKRVYS